MVPRESYLPRIADGILTDKLSYAGAVEIRGPKWCGKTETALQRAASAVMMQDPDERDNNLAIADVKPSLLLEGEKPLLIDEWQEAPQIWDAVRYAVDRSGAPGGYILTGSSTPHAKPRHSGTGRVSFLDMLPMSLSESGDSTCEVSLASLFDGNLDVLGKTDCDVERIATIVCRGGWPGAVTMANETAALKTPSDYVATICEEDISRADGVSRNAQHARVILAEYARCTATHATQATIRKDLKERGTELSRDTVDSYLATLRKLFVVQDLSAWTPSLHAKARVAKTPARHLCDPSIAAAALGASPASLLRDMSTLGMLFESMCVRDLRAYMSALEGELFCYRDEGGLEADAVATLRDGRYGLIEAKMSARLIDEGAANLIKLTGKINTDIMGAPAFCAIITPGGRAYRRADGVLVIPLACLAP